MTNDGTLKWMVAEDDATIREIVQLSCDIIGHTSIAFPNGKRALEWMTKPIKAEELPDVALLDIRMPGGPDGHELAAHIRRHKTLSNIAIVLMTAYELPGSQRDEVLTVSGADLLLFKPLPPMEELAETVQEIIAARQANRATGTQDGHTSGHTENAG